MANQFPVQGNTGPTSTESFIADRQSMWGRFNKLTTFAVIALIVLLLLMTIFLV